MLPNVGAKDGCLAIGQRIVLIRRFCHGQFAIVYDKPRPTGAKLSFAGFLKLFFKGIKRSEFFVDLFQQSPFRFAAFVRSHDFPIQNMVKVSAAVVAYGSAHIFRNIVQVFNDFFNRLVRPLGSFYRLLQIVDIGLVVFCMMDLHRFLVNMRLKGVVCVIQFR